MSPLSRILVAPLLFGAVVSCTESSPEEAVDSQSHALEPSGPVAIRGKWEGTFNVPKPDSLNPLSLFILAQGGGSGDGIGDFTLTIPHTMNMATFHLTGQYYLLPKRNSDGTDVMQIDLDEVCRLGVPAVCEGTGTINGGTGKFVNAKGTLDIRAEINFVTWSVTGVFDGKITY